MIGKKRSEKGNIAEFAIVIYVLFIMVLFPFINLLAVGTSSVVIYLSALRSATKASYQEGFYEAISSVIQEAGLINNTALAKFAKLSPVGGLSGTGMNLHVVASNCRNSAEKPRFFPANTPIPPPVDTLTYVYEYSVAATYDMQPMINMSGIPFLKDVPGLGKPARICIAAQRALEHPESLNTMPNEELSGGHASSPVDLATSGAMTPGEWDSTSSTDSGWNYPTIYTYIQGKGEKVLAEDVIRVLADNEEWTATSVTVSAGQTVWIDTRATGSWTGISGGSMVDADGGQYTDENGVLHDCAFLQGGVARPGSTSPSQWIKVGKTMLGYPITSPGTFTLRFCDAPGFYGDNAGEQVVRVILTGPA